MLQVLNVSNFDNRGVLLNFLCLHVLSDLVEDTKVQYNLCETPHVNTDRLHTKANSDLSPVKTCYNLNL